MQRLFWVTAFAAIAVMAPSAEGGVFRRKPVTVATTATVTTTTTTTTAQGAAAVIAGSGRFRHVGGNRGTEGIGLGATMEAAEASCCFRSVLIPRERGFARMANGMWVCVCRY